MTNSQTTRNSVLIMLSAPAPCAVAAAAGYVPRAPLSLSHAAMLARRSATRHVVDIDTVAVVVELEIEVDRGGDHDMDCDASGFECASAEAEQARAQLPELTPRAETSATRAAADAATESTAACPAATSGTRVVAVYLADDSPFLLRIESPLGSRMTRPSAPASHPDPQTTVSTPGWSSVHTTRGDTTEPHGLSTQELHRKLDGTHDARHAYPRSTPLSRLLEIPSESSSRHITPSLAFER